MAETSSMSLGALALILKKPASLVVVTNMVPFTETVAPGMGSPFASNTRPCMSTDPEVVTGETIAGGAFLKQRYFCQRSPR